MRSDDGYLNNGQQDSRNEEEEAEIEGEAIHLLVVSFSGFDFVSDSSTGAHSKVQVEQVTREQIRAMLTTYERRRDCKDP